MTPSPAPWPWIPSHTQLFCCFDQGVTSAILHPHSCLGAFAHAVLPSPDSFSLHSDIKPELVLRGPAQVSPCLEVSQHPRHRFLSLAPLALVPLYLLFFFFLIVLIYFGPCWVFVTTQAFSSYSEQRLLSSWGAWGSYCGGFS